MGFASSISLIFHFSTTHAKEKMVFIEKIGVNKKKKMEQKECAMTASKLNSLTRLAWKDQENIY